MTSSRHRNRQLFNEYFTLSQWRCAHGEPDTKRRMKVPCADVGCGDEMCDERVEYMAWNGDCLRTCQEKGRDVRRQKATQSVCQGLPAQMSVGEVRHAQTRCHRKHRMKIGCADVGIEAEMCAARVEYTVWDGNCLRTCREKGRDVCREKATQSVERGSPAQMSVEEVRHAQTRCHRKHRMKIGCADVGIEAEMCDERVEYTA